MDWGTAGNCPWSSVIIQGLSEGCLVVWPFRALLLPYWNCTIHAATRLPIAKEPCPLVDLHLTNSNGIHTFPFYHVIICFGTHQRPNWIQLVPHCALPCPKGVCPSANPNVALGDMLFRSSAQHMYRSAS